MKYRVGSLFAGVGGICLGFQQAYNKSDSYELVWANEIDDYACETYKTNFNHTLLKGDIRKILCPKIIDTEIEKMQLRIDIEQNIEEKEYLIKQLQSLKTKRNDEYQKYVDLHSKILEQPIDILNGGFPCQAFSIAGERLGFDDERGNLFLSIIELIKQLGEVHYKPRVLLLENVKNLQSHDHGRTYEVIKKELQSCGYTIYEKVLNTMDYCDLPQNRERIYIVGFLNNDDAKKFHLFDESYLCNLKIVKTKEDRKLDVQKIIDYSLTYNDAPNYYYTKEKYPRYFQKSGSSDQYINLSEQIDEMYQFYQCRRGMYVRKNKSNVCPTLTANMGTGGHNVPLIKVQDGIRKLTPKEVFKLQGFPIDISYSFPKQYKNRKYPESQLYKQAGNAVSVPIIKLIADYILEILGDKNL